MHFKPANSVHPVSLPPRLRVSGSTLLPSLSLRKDSQTVSFGNCLLAFIDIEFLVDVDCVSFDGLGGNEKLFGNLLVAQPLCQKGQDLNLTVRQGLIPGLGADR